MTKKSILWLLPFFVARLYADTVVLTSGEVVEGKIVKNNEVGIVIETKFSNTITEERLIPKAEIKTFTQQKEDVQAFEALKNEVLPISAMEVTVYDSYITAMKGFLAKYAYSSKVPEVRGWCQKAEKERQRVAAGEVKIQGTFLTAEQFKEEEYQLNALQIFQKIQASSKSNPVEALNEFILLEKTGAGSVVYITAVTNAKEILRNLQSVLNHEQRNFPIKEGERDKSILLAKPAVQDSIKAARAKDIKSLQDAIAAAKTAGVTFPPYGVFLLESMKNLQAVVEKEQQRINAIDLAPIQESLEETERASVYYAKSEWVAAQGSLNKALELWPANERAVRLASKVNDAIKAQKASNEKQNEAVKEGFTSSKKELPTAP